MPKTTIAGKKQLTERISRKTKFPQNQVAKIIDEFLDADRRRGRELSGADEAAHIGVRRAIHIDRERG